MPMNNPRISIVLPTYNRGTLIIRAIRSILYQTLGDFELIIIDDGSTDNTKILIDEFIKKDDRIKYIYQDNKGEAAARNKGLENAKGEFIAFIDSDDEWLPDKLEKQVELFFHSTYKNLGFVGCYGFIVKDNEPIEGYYKLPNYRGNILEKILESCFILSPNSILVKKEAILDKKFDENIKVGPDWDMWIQIAQEYSFDFVPEPLFKYYVHSNNISKTTNNPKIIKDQEYILKKHENLYQKHRRSYSIRLRQLGTLYLLAGEKKEASKYLIKSIKACPLQIRNYLHLFLLFFSKRFINLLLKMKRKLSGDILNQ